MLTVSTLLEDPLLEGAACVAGGRGAATREVRWTAVLHWPAVGFIEPGELVLTTGVGCDDRTLDEFLLGVVESEAAGMALSMPPTAPRKSLPSDLLARAEELAFPVVDMPWRIRFADIARRVVDGLLHERHQGLAEGVGANDFTRAVLDGEGLEGIGTRLEHGLEKPALLFDECFRLIWAGQATRDMVGGRRLDAVAARSLRLLPEELTELEGLLQFGGPRLLGELPVLELPSGIALAAVARRRVVGYVYVLDPPETNVDHALRSVDIHALEGAATALAVELVRQKALTVSDRNAVPNALWDLASSSAATRAEALRRVGAVGLDLRRLHDVAVGSFSGEARDQSSAGDLETALSDGGGTIAIRDEDALALRAHASPGDDLATRLASSTSDLGISWGVAPAPVSMVELPEAYREAKRLRDIGRRILGPGRVARAEKLRTAVMLSSVARNPMGQALTREVMGPLLAYDVRTGRDFLGTLETYISEKFNSSQAARTLYMNRQSLLYRLRKIEELTGLAFDSQSDRFLLELGVNLVRLGALGDEDGALSTA